MLRYPFIAALLLLSACASYKADYRERLTAQLTNRFDVQFFDEKEYPGRVLCGSYSSYEDNGFVRRTRDFVVTPQRVMPRPSEPELAVYCSAQPQAALYASLGIGGPDADWAALTKVRTDLDGLRRGVRDYYDSAYTLPRSLKDLVAWDERLEESQLLDPWGRPYEYRGGLAGRTVPNPEIFTLGADGSVGGRDDAADISLTEVNLLGHVLDLRGG